MLTTDSIITVGICPCWDIVCQVDGLEWGEHKQIVSQKFECAGKAFNICRALAWLEVKNIAAGLWGRSDYQQMLDNVRAVSDFVDIRFTRTPGRTRWNITVFDTRADREIHLRAESKLAGKESLRQLMADLEKIVSKQSTVVFAGAMPVGELLDDCLSIIAKVRDRGANIAIDTSGRALKQILELGGIWLIKPNVEELCELLDEAIEDEPASIAKAGQKICKKADIVIVSRGPKGAIVITQDRAFQGKVTRSEGKAVSAVGCGDYLLAGFLSGIKDENDIGSALARAIKIATARAYAFTEKMTWPDSESKIDVEVCEL